MAEEQRRLAAILVADVVGYSKLVGSDEAGTLARLKALRSDVIDPAIGKYSGRLFKSVGDGFLVEFASAVQAVTCAKAIQDANANGGLQLRIGIHVGDVIVQGDDLLGDGVNVAARIEGVAEAGGIALSRQVRDQVRDKLDIELVDKGDVELKNIARAVHIFTVGGARATSQFLPLPDKPSIAVLPFQNMSGDPEQEYFVDGLVEDIITALSRFKFLFVIARNSSFTYKGKAVDIKQVGRELGVRYVLEGSVRKAAGRLRIAAQLIDCQTGSHLWADRFDGALEDVFELQDQVTWRAVAIVAPRLERAELDRIRRKAVENLDAYDCLLRSSAAAQERTRASCDEALTLAYRAIDLEPDFATPYGIATFCYTDRKNGAWSSDPEKESAETRRLALQVQRIGADDGLALAHAGRAMAFVCRDYDIASAMVEQAVEANANLATAWLCRATVNLYNGEYAAGIDQLHRVMRMSPMDPASYQFEAFLGWGHVMQGDLAEAIAWTSRALAHRPDAVAALRVNAAANALSGNLSEAQRAVRTMLGLQPGVSISYLRRIAPYRRVDDVERLLGGLRLAGLPE